jgi:hypothetical protein
VGKSGLFTTIPLSPRLDGILLEIGAMTVEGIIAEALDLAAMRQGWTRETPRLRQGMRMLAYGPLSDAYRDLHTLDQAYQAPEPLPGIPDTWAVEVPEEKPAFPEEEEPQPATLPASADASADAELGLDDEELSWSTPPSADDESLPVEETDVAHRNLNLRGEGEGEEDGFDLLTPPFSQGEAEADEDR